MAQPARQKHFPLGTGAGGLAPAQTIPGGGEVHSTDRRLFCLRHGEHVCSLWVEFRQVTCADAQPRFLPKWKRNGIRGVWNWISVTRLKLALNYVPVSGFCQRSTSAKGFDESNLSLKTTEEQEDTFILFAKHYKMITTHPVHVKAINNCVLID